MKKTILLLLAITLLICPLTSAFARRHYIMDAVALSLLHHEEKVYIARRLEGKEMKKALYLSRKYIHDAEMKTNRNIELEQKQHLIEALRQKHFGKLQKTAKSANDKEFKNGKRRMIAEWEKHTGQTWPKYTAENAPRPAKIGQRYDLHHIIPKENGGPNVWWNSHPAASPSEHQAGIHASGSALRQLQDLIK